MPVCECTQMCSSKREKKWSQTTSCLAVLIWKTGKWWLFSHSSVLTLRNADSSRFESSSKPWVELPECQDGIRFKAYVLFSLRTTFGSLFRRGLAFIIRCLLTELLKSQGNLTLVNTSSTVFFSSHLVIYSTGLLELQSHQQQIQKQDLIWDLEQSCGFFWPGLLLCTDKDLARGSNLLIVVCWCSVFDLVSSNASRAVWLLSVQSILSATV